MAQQPTPADGKPRFVLIPPYAEAAVARVLTRGAAIYGDRDWVARISVPDGPDAFVDKALRHISEYRCGTRKDQGTGESPIANAIADLLFVLEHEITRGEGK